MRDRRVYLVLAVLSAMSWFIGFLCNEDSSGGAAYDFRTFHWPTSQFFAGTPLLTAIRDYSSATTPLQHMLMAQLPWVHDAALYRLTTFFIGTAALLMFGVAAWRRLEPARGAGMTAVLATAAVALSPGFRSASFWGDTDALPLLFTSMMCLLLHDGRTGMWRDHVSTGRMAAVAVLGAAAFYTRQLYIFLPIWSFWLLWPRMRQARAQLVLVFGATALPALMLFALWGGLTPPRFRQHGSLASLVYVGALAAPFALPFVLARRAPARRIPSKTTLLSLLGVFVVAIAIFHGLAVAQLGGGMVTKVALLLGPAGVLFLVVMAILGWWAIATAALSARDNAVLYGFAVLPLLLAGHVYQRYFDPLAFTMLILLASPPLYRRLLTDRAMLAGYGFFLGLEAISIVWYTMLGHLNANQ